MGMMRGDVTFADDEMRGLVLKASRNVSRGLEDVLQSIITRFRDGG